jgi:ABC-type transporter Mla subunit MlaD
MAALDDDASPPKDTLAFAVLIAMIILAAALFGVGVSGIASGRVQTLLRSVGTSPELRTEVARQRRDIADVSVSLDRMIGEASSLDARNAELVRRDAAQSEQLARLEEEMALLKAKFRALLPEDPLESLTNGGTDLLTLRSTLDLQAESNRNEFDALHRRIDRLESIVTPPEATGTVRAPVMHKRGFAPGRRAPKTN